MTELAVGCFMTFFRIFKNRIRTRSTAMMKKKLPIFDKKNEWTPNFSNRS
jgi:hypothetical protein